MFCKSAALGAKHKVQLFIGQVLGTAVGTKVFIRYGWRAGAALSMALFVWQLAIQLLRGPHCERYTWFGYQGGVEPRKSVVTARQMNASDEEEGTKEDSARGGTRSLGTDEEKMGSSGHQNGTNTEEKNDMRTT
jgi:hypothetical protein